MRLPGQWLLSCHKLLSREAVYFPGMREKVIISHLGTSFILDSNHTLRSPRQVFCLWSVVSICTTVIFLQTKTSESIQ